jgi:hypothetical protein
MPSTPVRPISRYPAGGEVVTVLELIPNLELTAPSVAGAGTFWQQTGGDGRPARADSRSARVRIAVNKTLVDYSYHDGHN